MQDLLNSLDAMKRPRLLIRAARIGMSDYRRETHLRRHLSDAPLPRPREALAQLMEIESELDARRKERAAGYSPARHVDVMIAIMGEARILRATQLRQIA